MPSDNLPPAVPAAPAAFDSGYLEWKQWSGENFARLKKADSKYFDAEVHRARREFGPGSDVLEVGFGSGAFLAYGRNRQWRMSGLEVNPDLVRLAREAGFNAECAQGLTGFADQSADLVVAFDVLEHIPQDQLRDWLLEVMRVLRPGGVFIARFPNGDSPFGLIHQNSDITHVTVLGSGKVEYLARAVSAELLFVGGQAQVLYSSSPVRWLRKLLGRVFRWALNTLVYLVYFRRRDFASENMTAVLRKPQRQMP